jgi:hypothetical protein
MAERGDIYGHINDEADMRRVFKDIRRDVAEADSRPILTELYRRAGLIGTAADYHERWGQH